MAQTWIESNVKVVRKLGLVDLISAYRRSGFTIEAFWTRVSNRDTIKKLPPAYCGRQRLSPSIPCGGRPIGTESYGLGVTPDFHGSHIEVVG